MQMPLFFVERGEEERGEERRALCAADIADISAAPSASAAD